MNNINLSIVGSIGIDTIETPTQKREAILGGSASYACAGAAFFTTTGMLSVVGNDFPESYRNIFIHMNIDLDGLQTLEGKTFRWSGIYEENMDIRKTLSTELNVFERFSPLLPENYQYSPYVFLANIHPKLQLEVLNKVKNPKFVLIDTMDIWINSYKSDLEKVIKKCDMLTLNESEAKLLTKKENLLEAAKYLIKLGPKYILIKKGAQGSLLYSKNKYQTLNAFPLDRCSDPTGAGDSFAGGLIGKLAAINKININTITEAIIYGTVVASFGIEDFSLNRLKKLTLNEIELRVNEFRQINQI